MEEELEHGRPVFDQQFFKFSYLIESTLDGLVGYPPMYSRNQHILVVRSVEDPDVPFGRHLAMYTPQKVTGQFIL